MSRGGGAGGKSSFPLASGVEKKPEGEEGSSLTSFDIAARLLLNVMNVAQ